MDLCPYCGHQVGPQAKFCPLCGMRLSGLQGGRYRIVRPLGQGGMGAVYLAEDRELFGRPCVIKEMLNIFVTASERRKAEGDFRREAELLARLNQPGHPSIPEIYGHFAEAGRHYLVMKYIAGENLEQRINRLGRPFTESELIRILLPVCDALVYMHGQKPPVIHRDIKPANIILGEDGRVWLVDFGLAKATLRTGAMVMMQGKTIAMGTPGYTPLEQWQRKPIPASDIYALGATMYHLLTGHDPRDRFADFPELDMSIIKAFAAWPPLRSVSPDVSEEVEDLVARALDRDPARRPTAAQMHTQLQVLVRESGDPVTRWLQRFGPPMARAVGVALAAFLRRLLWGTAIQGGDHGPGRGTPFTSEPDARSGTRRCRLCGGTGVVLGGIKCPICGGKGRW